MQLYQLGLRRQNPLTADIHRFLGGDSTGLVMESSRYAFYDLPQIHHALAACFPLWTLAVEVGMPLGDDFGIPARMRIEVAPGKYEDFVRHGARFYELPEGDRRVLLFQSWPCRRDDTLVFSIVGRTERRPRMEEEQAALRRWMQSNHYLRGHALRANGTLLSRSETVAWDDIALKDGVLETLRQNTDGLLKLREFFSRIGVPQKRGILLYGPPGTGKTMIGKALANIEGATFIYASAADADCLPSLRAVFELARRLRPTILFMEDLDLFARERYDGVDRSILGELLAQLDGLEENDGLIVVATTNDLEAIEPALRDRPSRFDVVLEIGLPDRAELLKILRQHLSAVIVEPQLLDRTAEASKGLSGSQVREVAFLAMQQAILGGHSCADQVPRITERDLVHAVERVSGRKREKQTVGFGPPAEATLRWAATKAPAAGVEVTEKNLSGR